MQIHRLTIEHDIAFGPMLIQENVLFGSITVSMRAIPSAKASGEAMLRGMPFEGTHFGYLSYLT